MAWGKNRRGGASTASSGGRRRPPGEPSEQDIARSIQQSAVRVRVALQLGKEDEEHSLQDVVAQFQSKFEAKRTDAVTQRCSVRVELLECGLNTWQNLVEMQRVVQRLKRPKELLTGRTNLRHDPKYDEWTLALGFDRHSEDALWRFASSLMLRLKSCGVMAKVLLPSRRLVLPLMSAFVEWGNSEIESGEYRWDGKKEWSEVVVNLLGDERQEIQRVLLARTRASSYTQDPISSLRYPGLVSVVDDMLNGSVNARKPVVVILRGIPGSGKSTLGREIETICRYREVAFTACSADFFFETPRGYVFDVTKLGAAHSKCRGDFSRAIQGDIPRNHDGRRFRQHVVLVDNTSTQRWEYEPYEDIAMSNGCSVHIIEMKCPDALIAFRMGQRNSHGVPPDKVVSMFMRWEEDLRAHCFTPEFEYPALTANPLSDGDVGGLTYLGLFLETNSQQKLLADIPAVHPNKAADHVTLFYRPNKQYTRDAELGAVFTVYGVEIVKDHHGQCVRVKLDERLPLQVRNKIPHITISTQDGVSASYSNDLLESATAVRTTIDPPLQLTVRIGAALQIQNQRVIIMASPFAVDTCNFPSAHVAVSDESISRAESDKEELQDPTQAGSTLFVLHIHESDEINDTDEDMIWPLWTAQVLRKMTSNSQTHHLLCVQRSQDSASLPTTLLLNNLRNRFLVSSSHQFEDMVLLSPSSCLFEELEEAIGSYLKDNDVGSMTQLTILTTVKETMQWPVRKLKFFQDAALSISYVGLSDVAMRYNTNLASPSSTTSMLDFLGLNIEERARNTVYCGMNALENAYAHVFGANVDSDVTTVRRMDSTLLGLKSNIVELCLVLPSEACSDISALKRGLLNSLVQDRTVRDIADSRVSNWFYFCLRVGSGYSPVFCVRIASRPSEPDSNVDVGGALQLKLCQYLQHSSHEMCDFEAYSVLTALLRSTLLRQCSSTLPSKCRLSSLINLCSERLVLKYFESACEPEARPTASDVTSGRIIFAFYGMLTFLSKLDPVGWRAAFGESLLALQGNSTEQVAWTQAMTTALAACKSVMASYRCVGEGLQKAASLNPEHHQHVLVTLIKARIDTSIGEAPIRVYLEVSRSCRWNRLRSLALCDKLRHAAAMIVPQDDDGGNANSAEFFLCEPSLAARRVDVTASSLGAVRSVLETHHALDAVERDSGGAAHTGDYVIRRVESDEEVLADLKRSA